MTLKPGKYPARAIQGSAALGYTKGGKEQVYVQLQLLDGPNVEEYVGWYGYFTDATTERTLESLRHMGWQGDNLFDLSTIGDADAPNVQVDLQEEEPDDKGEVRVRVRWINKLGSGQALKEKMSDEQAKAFAARMKGSVIAQRQKSGTPSSTSNGQRKPAAGMPQHEAQKNDDIDW